MSIDFDCLLAKVLHDPPYLLQVESCGKSRKKILQKSVPEEEHTVDFPRGSRACGHAAAVKVLFANLAVNFLEYVAYRCKGDGNVFFARNIILAHRVMEDWQTQCDQLFWAQSERVLVEIFHLQEDEVQGVVKRGWHVELELAELQDM